MFDPLEFLLWGYVKIEVFKSLQHLKVKGRITQGTGHCRHARQNLERTVETFKNAHR